MFSFNSVLVFGAGITGISVCDFLKANGLSVYLTDDNISKLSSFTNYNTVTDLNSFDFDLVDFFVISPGLRMFHNPHISAILAKKYNKPVWTDLDLLQEFYPNAKYLAITGTNGKSTTVSMLDHVLKFNNIDVFTSGNIGIPMVSIDKEYEYILLELSSYQLENARNLKIDFGCITNVSPSHLDHHGNFNAYLKAKIKICQKQAIVNGDDTLLSVIKSEHFSTQKILENGVSVVDSIIYLNATKIGQIDDFINKELPFKYHPQNVACVFWFSIKLGLTPLKIIEALKTYKPLAHRTEPVRKIGRMLFINDSKATNIPAAIKCVSENNNIVLIMGGQMLTNYDKLDDFFALKNNIKKVFLIGESAEFLQQKLNEQNIENEIAGDLKNAVKMAYKKAIQLTKNGKYEEFSVILSPMHPSTDQFKNFEERGDIFKNYILSL